MAVHCTERSNKAVSWLLAFHPLTATDHLSLPPGEEHVQDEDTFLFACLQGWHAVEFFFGRGKLVCSPMIGTRLPGASSGSCLSWFGEVIFGVIWGPLLRGYYHGVVKSGRAENSFPIRRLKTPWVGLGFSQDDQEMMVYEKMTAKQEHQYSASSLPFIAFASIRYPRPFSS